MKRQPQTNGHHLPYSNKDVPIQTTRFPPTLQPQPQANSSLRPRPTLKRTLTKRDRHVAPPPLVAPPSSSSKQASNSHTNGHPSFSLAPGFHPSATPRPSRSIWRISVRILTFPIPSFLLSLCNIHPGPPQQAWREKIVLCLIALLMGGVVGFVTMGLNRTLCPRGVNADEEVVVQLGTRGGTLGISGWLFDTTSATTSSSTNVSLTTLASQLPGQDVTSLFSRSSSDYPSCSGLTGLYATTSVCKANSSSSTSSTALSCPLASITTASTFTSLGITNTSLYVGYTWAQVLALENYMVLNGLVLNMSPYLAANPVANTSDVVDTIIRQVLSAGNTTTAHTNSTSGLNSIGTKDATRLMYNRQAGVDAVRCLMSRYVAGRIDKITPGCFVASLMLYALMIVILGIVMVRFAMALYFDWFLAKKLCTPPDGAVLANGRGRVLPTMSLMPEGASVSKDDKVMGIAPWAGGHNKLKRNGNGNAREVQPPIMTQNTIGAELFTFCLVTCYSEGEESIRNTLESIANTTYSDNRKMLFVVCDGMVTGHGEKAPTPDICVGMLEPDTRFGDPTPMAYLSVGGAAKRENRAYVYAGHYISKLSHKVPMLVVVKTGMPGEAKESKPGNRGKRDSQMILMNWISRVTYNDRFTPLDYDLFRKTHVLMGVTPDWFEVVLMVDADTTVEQKSLTMLVNCMHHTNVMGVCGETHIQNKWASWVSMIQTMEYVIAHRLAKAFEAVFGGVTCLPGCFSMYRLKVPKGDGDDWIPILVDTSVIREYSQGEVHTLHTKNLLLLGEDRFLSTLMIRTFPGRDMSFCPQAECHTIVPSSFRVLLSQRRRWTSSTIHNLMELMRVQNLCGIFCFSMQFVVFCELVGTATLPVAMCLTYANIINIALSPPKSFEESIPLILLIAVLGLPSLLVIATTRDVRHVFWTLVYLVLGLPVFNFIIPVHALWQQDNFAWGETRRVEGSNTNDSEVRPGKDDTAKVLAGTTTPLRRWADWERSRLRKLHRQEKRRRDLEGRYASENGHSDYARLRPEGQAARQYQGSRDTDTFSVASSDEDVWGQDVGGYNENVPPPLARPHNVDAIGGQVVGAAELNAMLESGWDEPSPRGFDRRQRQQMNGQSHHQPPPMQAPQPIQLGGSGFFQQQYRRNDRPHENGHANGNGHYHGGSDQFVIGNDAHDDNPFTDEHQQAMSTGVQPSPRTLGHAKKRSLANKQGQGLRYGPL